MSKTVLYILDYYLPHQWGVETVFEQIISRTLSKGWKAIILTSHFDKNLPLQKSHKNLKIIRTWNNRKSFIWKAFWAGKVLLQTEHIDLIHTSTYGGAIPASLLAKFFRKKILITVHEVFGKLWNSYKPPTTARIFRFFEWLIFQLPYDQYHCVSLYTLNALRLCYGIPDNKLQLIHNGVDMEFRDLQKITKEEKNQIQSEFWLLWKQTLLYFGHTGISKGIDILVAIIPDLLKQFPNLQLIFNFIPAQREATILKNIQQQLKKCKLNEKNRVLISHGLEKKKLRALVSEVDWVIAPSLSEGFWSVHTETIALGTPLITTQVASLPEVVGGKTILIPPQSKAQLLTAIQKLLNWDYALLPDRHFDRWEQYNLLFALYEELTSKLNLIENTD